MKFALYYRASMYLMLVLATLVLSADATSASHLAMLYPPGVAVAAALAWFTVDQRPKLGLGRDLANMLGLGSAVLAYIEYANDPDNLIIALGHWLVYLAIIKMFLPNKTEQDDWFLFMLGLVQVLIGGYISQSDREGVLLAAWALTALWSLWGPGACSPPPARPTRDGADEPITTPSPAALVAVREPYPGLFDRAFLLSALRVATTTLALGGLIFLVMPRWEGRAGRTAPGGAARHLTGFTDEVQLGQIGEILENDASVMRVTLYDADGRRLQPEDEPLWRGVVMQTYEGGRWHRQPTFSTEPGPFRRGPEDGPVLRQVFDIRQQIKIEPTDSPILFGIRPILLGEAGRCAGDEQDRRNPLPSSTCGDGSNRGDSRPIPSSNIRRSTTRSTDAGRAAGSTGRGCTRPKRRSATSCSVVPEDIEAQLSRPIAEADRRGDRPPRAGRGSAWPLERLPPRLGRVRLHAQDGAWSTVDVDPVLDFLVNRKEGHCEYYARCPDAPAPLAGDTGPPGQRLQGGGLEQPLRDDGREGEARP